MKKLLALVLALVMVMALGMTALADGEVQVAVRPGCHNLVVLRAFSQCLQYVVHLWQYPRLETVNGENRLGNNSGQGLPDIVGEQQDSAELFHSYMLDNVILFCPDHIREHLSGRCRLEKLLRNQGAFRCKKGNSHTVVAFLELRSREYP